MSMLAEPRSRQKWSDDPRNTRWSSDKSKFGYQMLEKMGWSEGSGLGQSLQGSTSHIKIKKKRNTHGIGMKNSHDDDWIAHQDSFNALLSQLNSGDATNDQGKKIQSLEDRVRVTKTKIMYSRFVKSKDLSRASSNDLACIFGQRSKSAPATPQRSEDEDENLSDGSTASCPTEKRTTEHGFTTINSGVSVADYFAKKMAALKQGNVPNIEVPTNTEVLRDEKSSEKKKKKKHEKKVVFDNIETSDESEEGKSDELDKTRKKKKRKKANDEIVEISDDGKTDEPAVEKKKKKHKRKCEENDDALEDSDETKCEVKKKKKKKKDSKVEDDELIVICEKKEYSRDRVENDDKASSTSSITTTSPKKKNKKKKHECNEINNDDMTSENPTTTTKRSKKKSKRKHEQVNNDDETTNTIGEERKKKHKRRHQSDDEDEKE